MAMDHKPSGLSEPVWKAWGNKLTKGLSENPNLGRMHAMGSTSLRLPRDIIISTDNVLFGPDTVDGATHTNGVYTVPGGATATFTIKGPGRPVYLRKLLLGGALSELAACTVRINSTAQSNKPTLGTINWYPAQAFLFQSFHNPPIDIVFGAADSGSIEFYNGSGGDVVITFGIEID